MWTVTRQRQWPDGDFVVEISSGGFDLVNPGALVSKYAGEGEEYLSLVEAVEKAIKIAQQWQKDKPKEEILIGIGATGGYTMPFDGMELTEETFEDLRKQAKEHDDRLPKCDRCGEILGDTYYTMDDNKYCREYCLEEDYKEFNSINEEEE